MNDVTGATKYEGSFREIVNCWVFPANPCHLKGISMNNASVSLYVHVSPHRLLIEFYSGLFETFNYALVNFTRSCVPDNQLL